ncbi:MAG TPA: HypC/HybG/HupF family hydrogenase formation chaperone [Ideonella sp.]|uniref:HypC/HybG/HupF family hydrogenase formation chaperone n=1 Tax=Ideonella sp. TaxID=1929293 RepID=UPI002C295E5F|nr:HypC/HybG/HupF family hydrogenase formation chaperone [Ideonella sp.]HSI49686.1 HypC/HybG/HupF family hydrogenase formation chaperone [Ideonella sp.]
MCIGIPMQVADLEPGHAICVGRGERRRVNTALVGDLQLGDWLLVFLDSAQERISATRADEVNATLDLLAAVQTGEGGGAAAGFPLPSQLSAADLLVLTGTDNTMETPT